MLWQALNLNSACHAVVAWLAAHRHVVGLPDISPETGAYCTARKRLPEHVLPVLSGRVADDLRAQATVEHLWCGRSVFRLHQSRRPDFRRGRALAVGDHVVSWKRPGRCPGGLRAEDCAQLPATLRVREIRYQVAVKGFRTQSVTLATTLLDAEAYPAEALAELYFRRWEIEVDFRHLKTTMRVEVLRGQSPAVVEKEFWAHVLAYNLTRRLMWEAGRRMGSEPLRLSLKGAMDHVVSRWHGMSGAGAMKSYNALLASIGADRLPERPGRAEPRVKKRRAKGYPLMQQPRAILKRMLTG